MFGDTTHLLGILWMKLFRLALGNMGIQMHYFKKTSRSTPMIGT